MQRVWTQECNCRTLEKKVPLTHFSDAMRKNAISSLVLPFISFTAHAVTYTTPNLDSTAVGASRSVTLEGSTFVNQGLVGVGVFAADAIDGLGDTLGSFSSFKVDLSSWRKTSNGSYAGSLLTLPDRGYNVAGLIAYAARIQKFDLSFTPDYTTNVVTQTQLSLTFRGTTALTDFNGNTSTAVNPTGTGPIGGYSPVPTANGLLSIDGEGLTLRSDGSFYVADEYGATVYNFDKNGKMKGIIVPPKALIPQFSTTTYSGFNTDSAAIDLQTGGRRDNQGLEGVTLTPDGRYLVTLLQSATRQDNPTNTQDQNRIFTRLMVYDTSTSETPTSPIGHYLVELPSYRNSGNGTVANKTAAQSEILALSSTSFLVLSRDGAGNGSGNNTNPAVFKSVVLLSTKGATNLAGTTYETSYTPATVLTDTLLAPVNGIVAASTTDFVNILNVNQLARFGLNLNVGATTSAAPVSSNSIGEKWEALSLVPVLDASAPNDYFLLVGNDNDFITAKGTMLGTPYNSVSTLVAENVNRILVYRVTLPGYVDPGLIDAATATAPLAMARTKRVIESLGGNFGGFLSRRLSGSVRLAAPTLAMAVSGLNKGVLSGTPAQGITGASATAEDSRLSWWMDGSFRSVSEGALDSAPSLDSHSTAGALGLEGSLGSSFSLGLGLGVQGGASKGADGSKVDYTGNSLTAYLVGRTGRMFGSLAVTAGLQDFSKIERAGAYGGTSSGATDGSSVTLEGNIGGTVSEFSGWTVVPVLGLSHSWMKVNAYSESGGFGPLSYQRQSFSRSAGSASVELARAFPLRSGSVTPFVRGGFDKEFGSDDKASTVSIASGSGAGTSVSVSLPSSARDFVSGAVGTRWKLGKFDAEVSYEYRTGNSGYRENRVNVGLSSSF
ncbi:MAG: hypothetical protein DVB28_001038 [Verrucomicrobia bacterium]|nr:MAG: hypothetical protein DVB28_001038 [Verrucomicrobiota bacterium]